MQAKGIYDDDEIDIRRDRLARMLWQAVDAPATTAPAPDLSRIEDAVLAILDAPAASHETIEVAFSRKERELASLFAQLSVLEARAMHARLANASPRDRVAASFGRLVIARRTRLLALLADARRRQATAGGRRRG